MKTEFKKGDAVYWGTLEGNVIETSSVNGDRPLYVIFKNLAGFYFTSDGRINVNTPIALSHFPYEVEMKKVEPIIEKDTPVWHRDSQYEYWRYGYYSHFEKEKHFVYNHSKKSSETTESSVWDIVTTENPLK